MGLKPGEPIHDICGFLEAEALRSWPFSTPWTLLMDCPLVKKIRERISIERQIFTTAHELGHLLIHLANYDGKAHSEDKALEREADLFAGYFLMPEQGFDFYACRLSRLVRKAVEKEKIFHFPGG